MHSSILSSCHYQFLGQLHGWWTNAITQGLPFRRGLHAKDIKLFVHHLTIFNNSISDLYFVSQSDGATEAYTDGLEPWLTDTLIPAASLPPWDGFSATCSPISDQSLVPSFSLGRAWMWAKRELTSEPSCRVEPWTSMKTYSGPATNPAQGKVTFLSK